MKNVILIAGTNSSSSINRQLLWYVARKLRDVALIELKMDDYILPIYGIDLEKREGIPELVYQFKQKIKECDGILVALAEHNGAYSVAFKNVLDWVSRVESDVWLNKPMFVMATSPGKRGAIGVLDMFYSRYSPTNKRLVGKFSLPEFNRNFGVSPEKMIEPYETELSSLVSKFQSILFAKE